MTNISAMGITPGESVFTLDSVTLMIQGSKAGVESSLLYSQLSEAMRSQSNSSHLCEFSVQLEFYKGVRLW